MRNRAVAFRAFTAALLCLNFFVMSAACAGDQPGLRAGADSQLWPRVAVRLGLGLGAGPSSLARTPVDASDMPVQSSKSSFTAASVLGDLYFEGSRRFHATGGMLFGNRTYAGSSSALLNALPSATIALSRQVWLAPDEPASDYNEAPMTVPYFGFGYYDTSWRNGWGFSADVGLLALAPQPAVRLGRVFSGEQTFDDYLRDLRLTPRIQLGVSYSF